MSDDFLTTSQSELLMIFGSISLGLGFLFLLTHYTHSYRKGYETLIRWLFWLGLLFALIGLILLIIGIVGYYK
jgi:hypothetical protein